MDFIKTALFVNISASRVCPDNIHNFNEIITTFLLGQLFGQMSTWQLSQINLILKIVQNYISVLCLGPTWTIIYIMSLKQWADFFVIVFATLHFGPNILGANIFMTLVFQPEDLIKCQSMWVENIPISIVSTLIEIGLFLFFHLGF